MRGQPDGREHPGKGIEMDWIRKLKERIGVSEEGYAADLNDMEGREMLTERHLDLLKEKPTNMDASEKRLD